MENAVFPRVTLKELACEAELTNTRFLIVEGESDFRFFDIWVNTHELDQTIQVQNVSFVDVSGELLRLYDLNESNRNRVAVAINEISDKSWSKDDNYYFAGVIDRDLGNMPIKPSPQNLFVTDFPALESYVLQEAIYDGLNHLQFQNKLPPSEELFPKLFPVLYTLYYYRKRFPNWSGSDIKIHTGLKNKHVHKGIDKLAAFRYEDALADFAGISGSFEVPDYTASNLREFAYGHDIGQILTKAFTKEFASAGFRSIEPHALEGAFYQSLLAMDLTVFPFFCSLYNWLNSEIA